MTIEHHVSDELLFAYATGELGPGWSLAVATHLAMCPQCRAQVADYERLGGVRLEEELAPEETELNFDADAIFDIAGGVTLEEERHTAPTPGSNSAPVFPEPLRSLSGDLDEVKWSFVGGGVRQAILSDDGETTARLLYIPAGFSVPSHGHGGLELTLVMSGGFYDGSQAFSRGDMQIVSHETPHQPVAMDDQPCVCLAITDAPLKFSNFLPRLFQPFFKI